MHVEFQSFRGMWISWHDLFTQAAEFADSIGPDRLISISHSADNNDGVVTVWYWSSAPETGPERR